MSRLLIALALAAAVVLVVVVVVALVRRNPSGAAAPALAPGDGEARRIGTEMARLLEAGLVDPVLRTSSSWEERAEALVRDWYGSERPGGGSSS